MAESITPNKKNSCFRIPLSATYCKNTFLDWQFENKITTQMHPLTVNEMHKIVVT
jgi:hypothetical protein